MPAQGIPVSDPVPQNVKQLKCLLHKVAMGISGNLVCTVDGRAPAGMLEAMKQKMTCQHPLEAEAL